MEKPRSSCQVESNQASIPASVYSNREQLSSRTPLDWLKLTRLRNEATALRSRQEFQRAGLTELGSTDFESWAKESYEIASKIAYQNGRLIGAPRSVNKDCSMLTMAPVLPVGYIAIAKRIADRRIILARYRLADLLTRVTRIPD